MEKSELKFGPSFMCQSRQQQHTAFFLFERSKSNIITYAIDYLSFVKRECKLELETLKYQYKYTSNLSQRCLYKALSLFGKFLLSD